MARPPEASATVMVTMNAATAPMQATTGMM